MRSSSIVLAVSCLCVALSACSTGSDLDASNSAAGDDVLGGAEDALTVTTTLDQERSNNTSASPLFTDLYTPAPRFNGVTYPVSNGDAPASPIAATDLKRGRVSKVPVRSLLYPGSTTKIFVETQAWFCTKDQNPLSSALGTDQCGSHIDIGIDSNSSAYVKREVDDMVSRGIDGVILNWTGQAAGTGVVDQKSTSSAALNTGNMFLIKQEAEKHGGAFKFSIMEDEGVKQCASTQGCDVTAQVVSDLIFLANHFYGSPAYLRQDGRPVVFFFSIDHWVGVYGKTLDWAKIRTQAPGNPLFIFENSPGFDHAYSDGAYAWVHPGTTFYSKAKSEPSKQAWGTANKGFDDYVVNGWGGGRRFDGQRCGQRWLETFDAVNANYSGANQLYGVQLETWDDYEEGTELETGIDNHVALSASMSGTKLSWNIAAASDAPGDCKDALAAGFDLQDTIHHFTVFASLDGKNLGVVADNLPASARSLELAGKLPSGKYTLYVKAIGQPLILNQLSNAVPFGVATTPPPPPASASVSISSPAEGTTVLAPVHVVAKGSAGVHVNQLQIWSDGVKYLWSPGDALDVSVAMPAGAHQMTVLALDDSYQVIAKTVRNFTAVEQGVTIHTPADGAVDVANPVHVVASAVASTHVSQQQIWVDGDKYLVAQGDTLDASIMLPAGTRALTVVALDDAFQQISKTTHTIGVSNQDAVAIITPRDGDSVASTFRIRAVANSPGAIDQMQIWADGKKVLWLPGASLDVNVTLGKGAHEVTVLSLDKSYALSAKSIVHVTVQ